MAWNYTFPIRLNWYCEKPPLVNYLNQAQEECSVEKKRIFNTRVKDFKIWILIYMVYQRKKLFNFLSDDKLIKRSFWVYEEEKVILGFNAIEYVKQFM